MTMYLFRSRTDQERYGRGPWWHSGETKTGEHIFTPIVGGQANVKAVTIALYRIDATFREVPV